jgi:hypothetical protein
MSFAPRLLSFLAALLCTAALLCLNSASARAQQAIVNMPSADITPSGRFFAMHESVLRPWRPNRYWYGTNFFCYGVGHHTELALTTWNVGISSPRTSNETVGLGFKSSLPVFGKALESREMRLTIGHMGLINTRGLGLGGFSYAHLNGRLWQDGPRLTAGLCYGSEELFKRAASSFMGGVEIPLQYAPGRKFARYVWVNEWFSGTHDFSSLITGLLWHPDKDHIVVVAYRQPNTSLVGKSGLVLEYGLFF